MTVLLTNTNWWPCSAHLAIAMAAADIRVAAVYPPRGHPLRKTSAVSLRFNYRATSPIRSLLRAIENSSADLIVPCDDRAVAHLHRLYLQQTADGTRDTAISRLIERSLGSPEKFQDVSSRFAFLRHARSENVPVPEVSQISSVNELQQWSNTHPLPWVMKTDGSWGGLGVKLVSTMQEAIACFQRLSAPLALLPTLKRLLFNRDPYWIESWWQGKKSAVTVQSFIEGRPANCAVFCWKGRVLAGIPVAVVAAQEAMGPATIVRVVEGRRMIRAAELLAARLNLSGFYGFDFMIEARSDVPYLVEMNPRCTMPCHLRLGAGRDLLAALRSVLSGRVVNDEPLARFTELISYFPQAWLSDPCSVLLRDSYHDVPWTEPALVRELMRLPFPDRSLLAQLSDRIRHLSYAQRSARKYVFGAEPHADNPAAGSLRDCHLGAFH